VSRWKSVPLAYAAASPIHGTGLFARKPIEEGAFIGIYEGERTEENGMHVLWVEDAPDDWVGYDGNNDLRFLNHSKSPNAELDGQALYSLRQIHEGEEITIDYGEWFEQDE
jgi:SET domain-containing protein